MEDQNVFRFGDFEGVFDISDYVQMEALEAGSEALAGNQERMEPGQKKSEELKTLALIITDELMDPIFGEGASKAMFGDRITSVNVLLEATFALLEYAKSQGAESKTNLELLQKKAAGNRQNRRNVQQVGRK